MTRQFRSEIRSFQSAVNVLNGKEGRKTGNNTTLIRHDNDTISARLYYTDIVTYHRDGRIIVNTTPIRHDNDTISARLHYTDIVTYHRDGRIIVNTGDYKSATTKHRINGLTNIGVYQKDYNWYLCDGTPFCEGMDVGGCARGWP